MTKEEIRQKAIECRKLRIDHCNSHKKVHWVEPCTTCEHYEPYAECTTIFAYEHGFADGVEEGKRLAFEVNKQLIEKVCSRYMALALDQSSNLFACKDTVSRDDIDHLIKNSADVVERYFLKEIKEQ